MRDSSPSAPSFYEFFAGGGMVRAGLGAEWTCLFANDFDAKKGFSYQANWGTGGELTVGDIRALDAAQLQRIQGRYALVTMCHGGSEGVAMIIERQ